MLCVTDFRAAKDGHLITGLSLMSVELTDNVDARLKACMSRLSVHDRLKEQQVTAETVRQSRAAGCTGSRWRLRTGLSSRRALPGISR